jgi:alkylhydroperoxidase family enzyme
MPRIPYARPDDLEPESRALLESAPINVVRMLVNASPAVARSFVGFSQAFFSDSGLPADLREIGILRAGYVAGSDYETWQHESIARGVGLSDAQIDAVRQGGRHPDVLSPAQQAVLDFADEVITDVRAGDAVLAEVRRHLADDRVVDLIMVTGLYMMVSRFIETTGVERDEESVDATFVDSAFRQLDG